MKEIRVLVVDDDEEFSRLLADYLTRWGYKAQYTIDDKEALNEYLVFRPHVVLLDVRLPRVDCLTLLREMLAEDPEVSVIVISGFVDQDIARQAIRLGACDYISKPFDADQLKRVISLQVADKEEPRGGTP